VPHFNQGFHFGILTPHYMPTGLFATAIFNPDTSAPSSGTSYSGTVFAVTP
jgi:hypothetical protein